MVPQNANVNQNEADVNQDADINQDIAAGLDHPDDRHGSAPDVPGLGEEPDAGEAAQRAAFPGASGSAADINDAAGSGDHTDLDDAIGQSDASGQAGSSRPAD